VTPLFRVIDWFRRQVWWGKKKEEKGKTQQQNQHPFHLVVKKRIVQIPFLPSNTNSFLISSEEALPPVILVFPALFPYTNAHHFYYFFLSFFNP